MSSAAAATTNVNAAVAGNKRTVWRQSLDRAIGGGVSGAAAMGVQVLSLMWLRTTVNYQYRHGASMPEAFKTLYREGGVRRFYRGVGPALLQGPLSRFGDTAANAGIFSLLDNHESTKNLPVGVKTAAASLTAATWRVCLMPIDTLKTSLQVNGKDGLSVLASKFRRNGVTVFYHGALAASAANFMGHFPWFFTYNYLQSTLPRPDPENTAKKLTRNALIGFTSSIVSDTISNSVRVIKTYRQTHDQVIPYRQAVREVVAKDGLVGLFGRGLKTKILSNGVQGLMFSILWKLFEDHFKTA